MSTLSPPGVGRTPVWSAPGAAAVAGCAAVRHGTEAAYTWYRCRCPAARERHRLYRKRRRERRAGPRLVDATGTARRLQALVALGWPPDRLAAELGYGATNAVRNLLHANGRRVHVATAAAVTELYERYSMTPGPSTRARSHARRRSWVPPLAWDCDADLDNPAATPAAGALRPPGRYYRREKP